MAERRRTQPGAALARSHASALRELITTRAPACSEPARHHQADAAGAAGDEGALSGQVEKLGVGAELAVGHWVLPIPCPAGECR